MSRVMMTIALCLAASRPASACAACFGAANDPQTEGMNAAILTLLGVTFGVLLFIASLIVRIAVRIRAFERVVEFPTEDGA